MCVTCASCTFLPRMEFNVSRVECALKASARHRGTFDWYPFSTLYLRFLSAWFQKRTVEFFFLYGLWTKVAQFLARPKKATLLLYPNTHPPSTSPPFSSYPT